MPVRPEDVEDLAAEVLLQIVNHDYAVLRQFRGQSSLATYLTVIARRTCVHELARRAPAGLRGNNHPLVQEPEARNAAPGNHLENADEVAELLKKLPEKERSVVRLYF